MHSTQLIVRFKASARQPEPPRDGPFQDEVERFAALDPRWRDALQLAAARLDAAAQCTLGVALSGLEAGPAPLLMSYDFEPDDAAAIAREIVHMDGKILSALGILTAERLGLEESAVAKVHGIISTVHRLLRIAKTRPQ